MAKEGAPFGNKNGEIAKTPESKNLLLENYIKHVTDGYSDESFPDCDMKTFRRYCEAYPVEFPADRIEEARRARQLIWEQMGLEGMLGKYMSFNGMIWKFNMQNRFNWREKRDVDVTDKREMSEKEKANILKEGLDEEATEETSPSDSGQANAQTPNQEQVA